ALVAAAAVAPLFLPAGVAAAEPGGDPLAGAAEEVARLAAAALEALGAVAIAAVTVPVSALVPRQAEAALRVALAPAVAVAAGAAGHHRGRPRVVFRAAAATAFGLVGVIAARRLAVVAPALAPFLAVDRLAAGVAVVAAAAGALAVAALAVAVVALVALGPALEIILVMLHGRAHTAVVAV